MASRAVWSHGGGRLVADLVGSALISLLLRPDDRRPAYFSSPWMSDFVVVRNWLQQFAVLFPELADRSEVRFADYLGRLSRNREVRLITTENPYSMTFLQHLALRGCRVQYRLAKEDYHEKGILGPGVYIEGSMNLTHSGVYLNDEKITLHTETEPDGQEQFVKAYLEFDRRWENLAKHA